MLFSFSSLPCHVLRLPQPFCRPLQICRIPFITEAPEDFSCVALAEQFV
jgi:hypothetical protein